MVIIKNRGNIAQKILCNAIAQNEIVRFIHKITQADFGLIGIFVREVKSTGLSICNPATATISAAVTAT
ncbi:hypothetical protein D3C73_962130 [compost metagenome]